MRQFLLLILSVFLSTGPTCAIHCSGRAACGSDDASSLVQTNINVHQPDNLAEHRETWPGKPAFDPFGMGDLTGNTVDALSFMNGKLQNSLSVGEGNFSALFVETERLSKNRPGSTSYHEQLLVVLDMAICVWRNYTSRCVDNGADVITMYSTSPYNKIPYGLSNAKEHYSKQAMLETVDSLWANRLIDVFAIAHEEGTEDSKQAKAICAKFKEGQKNVKANFLKQDQEREQNAKNPMNKIFPKKVKDAMDAIDKTDRDLHNMVFRFGETLSNAVCRHA